MHSETEMPASRYGTDLMGNCSTPGVKEGQGNCYQRPSLRLGLRPQRHHWAKDATGGEQVLYSQWKLWSYHQYHDDWSDVPACLWRPIPGPMHHSERQRLQAVKNFTYLGSTLQRANSASIIVIMRKAQVRWAGHITCMPVKASALSEVDISASKISCRSLWRTFVLRQTHGRASNRPT